MNSRPLKSASFLLACLLLNSCASFDFFKLKQTPETVIQATKTPPQWQAPLPHAGETAQLNAFWQQFDDDLLLTLINKAQQVSVNLASAKSRIAEARAARISMAAASTPSLDASVSATRSVQQPAGSNNAPTGQGGNFSAFNGAGAINTLQTGLQAAWELDILGTNRANVESAKKTESAAVANWHEARVAVAAELATSYFSERYCQAQLALNQQDLRSRQETARLTAVSVQAGFMPKASQALADASVFDAKQQVNAQIAQCDSTIKELVALTDEDETGLREKLANQAFAADNLATKDLLQINQVPAQVIAQRPDIYNAEAELNAAATKILTTKAQQMPRVSLNGSIGWMWLSGVGFSSNGKVWSLGPVSITLPIFDAGKRKAQLGSAEAQYEESAAKYRSKVRQAVKEVELALVQLHSADVRQQDLQAALQGYQASFNTTQAKVKAGFANLIELEESRRLTLQTETALTNLQKDRTNAWVTLYRAVGGDWQTKQAETRNADKKTGLRLSPSLQLDGKENVHLHTQELDTQEKAVTP